MERLGSFKNLKIGAIYTHPRASEKFMWTGIIIPPEDSIDFYCDICRKSLVGNRQFVFAMNSRDFLNYKPSEEGDFVNIGSECVKKMSQTGDPVWDVKSSDFGEP
ncbi:MAG: hypothetical protein PHI12_12585 [Dehalococcoidales bacterium]|nr:hypothetical protein [Dehalococcoidales bacterium]